MIVIVIILVVVIIIVMIMVIMSSLSVVLVVGSAAGSGRPEGPSRGGPETAQMGPGLAGARNGPKWIVLNKKT